MVLYFHWKKILLAFIWERKPWYWSNLQKSWLCLRDKLVSRYSKFVLHKTFYRFNRRLCFILEFSLLARWLVSSLRLIHLSSFRSTVVDTGSAQRVLWLWLIVFVIIFFLIHGCHSGLVLTSTMTRIFLLNIWVTILKIHAAPITAAC